METLRIDGYIAQDDAMSAFFGDSGFFSLKKLNEFLDKLPAGTKDLKIEINSGGGSVTEGFAIHDKLASSGLNIQTEVLGMCGSIATIIALSAKPENRTMHQNSEYFIHNPFWQPTAPDPMEADDLKRIAEDLQASEEKILAFYADKTGQKQATIKPFMQRATSFSADEAKSMGFVTKVIGETVATRKYLIAAFVDSKQKTTDMEFTPAQKSVLEKMFTGLTEKFNKVFTPVFKAMTVDLESGAKIWIESETEDIVGKSVFLADDTGNKTNNPAPDGDYKTTAGKTIKVAGGKVTEVVEAQNETAALKKQVQDLTSQLEAEKAKNATAEIAKAEQQKQIVAFKSQLDEFRGMLVTKEVQTTEQTFKGDPAPVKKSEAQQLKEYREKKAAEAKK